MSKNYNVRFQPAQNHEMVECYDILPNGDCFYLSIIKAISLSRPDFASGLTVKKLRYTVQHKLAELDWSCIVTSIISDIDNASHEQKLVRELPGYKGIFKQVVNNFFAIYVERGCDALARQQAERALLSLGERGKLTYLDMVANTQAWAGALEIANLTELMNLVAVRIEKPHPMLPDTILEANLQNYTAVVPGQLIVPMLSDAGNTHFDAFNPISFHEAKGVDVVAYAIAADMIKEASLLIDPSQMVITIPGDIPSPAATPARAKRDKPLTFHDLDRLANDYVKYNMLPDLTLDENLELMESLLGNTLVPDLTLKWLSMLAGDMHKNHRLEANNHNGINWFKLSKLALGLAYDGKLYTAVPSIKELAFNSDLIKNELAELLNAIKLIRRNPRYHQTSPITSGLSALSEFLIDGDRFQSLGNEIIQARLDIYSQLGSKKDQASMIFSLVTIFRIAEGVLSLSEISRSFFPRELLKRLDEMRNIICHPEKSASWKEVEAMLLGSKSELSRIDLGYFVSNVGTIVLSFYTARKFYNLLTNRITHPTQDEAVAGILYSFKGLYHPQTLNQILFEMLERKNLFQSHNANYMREQISDFEEYFRSYENGAIMVKEVWNDQIYVIALPDKIVVMDDKAILRSLLDHYRTKKEETSEELVKLGSYLEEHREYGAKGHACKKEYDELRVCFERMSLDLNLYQPHLSLEDMKKAADLVESKQKKEELVKKVPKRVTNFYLLKEWRLVFRCLVNKDISDTEQALEKQEKRLDKYRHNYTLERDIRSIFGSFSEKLMLEVRRNKLYEKGILTDYPSLQMGYVSNISKLERLKQRYRVEEKRQQLMQRYLESKHLADIFAKVILCLERVIEIHDSYIKNPSPQTVMEMSLVVHQANLEFYIMLAGSLIRSCKENPANCGSNITFSQLTNYVITKERDKEVTLREKLDNIQMLRGQAAHIHTPAAGITDTFMTSWNFHGESYRVAQLCVPYLRTLLGVLREFVQANSFVEEVSMPPEVLDGMEAGAYAARAMQDKKWQDHVAASKSAEAALTSPH